MNDSKLNDKRKTASVMPGMGLTTQENDNYEVFKNYTVRYYKADIDDPEQVNMLQMLETKSLLADEIVLTDRQTWSDKGSFFVIIRYLEKRP